MKRLKFTPDTSEVRVNKQTHFTITPIKDIEAWKAERQAIEAEYHKGQLKRFSDARERAIEGVKGERPVSLTTGIDSLESAYMDAREHAKEPTKITWEQIQAKMSNWDAKNERARACKLGLYDGELAPRDIPSYPKPSLYENAKRAIFRFIRGAFPQ